MTRDQGARGGGEIGNTHQSGFYCIHKSIHGIEEFRRRKSTPVSVRESAGQRRLLYVDSMRMHVPLAGVVWNSADR